MRFLYTIVLSLICFAGFSQRQAPTGFPSPNSAGYSKVGFYRADSAFLLGIRPDTNWHPIVPALSGVKFAGRDTTELYFFDGVKWKISGSGGGTSTKVDSVTESADSLFYWINGTEYFIGTVSGTSIPYVDSIYIRSGENTDSLYYTKNGTEYNWGVLDVANGLIHGGNVTWTGTGFDFFVSAATYRINGTRYTSRDTTLTLTSSDPTNPRIDVFLVNSSGVATFLTGTAASNPVTPQIDPDTDVFLTSILIPATSTSPTIDTTTVYDENIEWTGSAVGTTINTANTVSSTVYRGTYSTEVGPLSNNDVVKYVAGAPINVAYKQALAFFLKLRNVWVGTKNLRVRLYSGGVAVGSEVTIPLNKASAFYQGFTIPIASFALSSTTIDEVRFRYTGSGSVSGIFLDWVYFQTGITPTPTVDYVENVRRSGDSVQQYINGSWQYAFTVSDKADKSINITAGDGLVGGGDLSANRSFRVDTSQVANKIWVTDRLLDKVNIADTSSMLSPYIRYANYPLLKTSQTIIADTGRAVNALATGGALTKVADSLGALIGGAGMTNPMTTTGDLILGGASGTPTRLGIGANATVLTSNGTTASWQAASGISIDSLSIRYSSSANTLYTKIIGGAQTGGGTNSTLIGVNAGRYSTANGVTLLGVSAGANITSGINTAVGYNALSGNVTGAENTAIGFGTISAASTNVTGNTAVGHSALTAITNGYNVGIGPSALGAATNAYGNIAIGQGSLGVKSGTWNYNVMVGMQSGYFTAATGNVGLGFQSLYTNASGTYNTAVGYQSGYSLTGSNNAIFGYVEAPSNGSSNQIAIGGNTVRWITRFTSGNFQLNTTSSNVSETASAALEINGTTAGFLPPRMTRAQKVAISSPAAGLHVVDTDSKAIWLNLNGSTTTWGAIYAAQDTVATDADFTMPVYSSFVILPTISSNRTVTLPVAPAYENKTIIIKVANSAGFAWSVAVAIKDKTDADVTALTNDTVYTLYSDGTYWHITSLY